jgi:hypothetical protein
METNGVHTYQVRSAQAYSLSISQFTATSYRAVFTFTGGNLKDLTNNNSTIASNLTINVVIWDNGEPGSGVDGIYYEVKDGNTLLYQSDCNGSIVSLAPLTNLAKGNIQIHTLGAKAGAITLRDGQSSQTATAQVFELRATPNPTRSYFTVQLPNVINSAVNVRVIDILGRVVETRQNLAAGQTLRIGSGYKPGVYIVEVTQGTIVKQLKLVKE